MSTLKIRYPWPTKNHSSYGVCTLCGPKRVLYELRFDQGSVAPVAGETLTGANSGHTGVVATQERGDGETITQLFLEGGSWAGGDAVGFVVLESCTGVTEDDEDGIFCFEDNEAVSGDSGATLVADDVAVEKVYMIPWPESMLYKYEGKLYCPYHFRFRSRRKEIDKSRLPSSIFND